MTIRCDDTLSDNSPRFDDGADILGELSIRLDRMTLSALRRTEEGFLIVEARISQPDILKYRRGDGSIRRELVPASTLHDAASLESLKRKPIVLEHPTDSRGQPVFIGPSNFAEFAVGEVSSDPRIDDDGSIIVELTIKRQDAIEAVEGGIREVSPGYKVRCNERAVSDPLLGDADATQAVRRYNHIALTRRGRGGSDIALRADSAIIVTDGAAVPTIPSPHRGSTMLSAPVLLLLASLAIRVDSFTSDAEALAAADVKVKDLSARLDSATAAQATSDARADSLAGEVEALKAADTDAERLSWFTDRRALEEAAAVHRIDSAEFGDMDNDTIRKAIVIGVNASAKKDGSPAYYEAAFDMLPADPRADSASRPSMWNDRDQGQRGPGEKRVDGADEQIPDMASEWKKNADSQLTARFS